MGRNRPRARALLLMGLLWGGLPEIVARIPYQPHEPLPRRWLRKAAEHPLRAALASGLLLLSLRSGSRKPRNPPSQGPQGPFEGPVGG